MGDAVAVGSRLTACLAAALLGAGCVDVGWNRTVRFEPPPPGATARLHDGAEGLQECLDLLGAPLWVWDTPTGEGQGFALAYGWYEERGWSVAVSYPVADYVNASFDYDQADERMRGIVLFFDDDARLVSWRMGLLRDLTRERERRRPTPVDI